MVLYSMDNSTVLKSLYRNRITLPLSGLLLDCERRDTVVCCCCCCLSVVVGCCRLSVVCCWLSASQNETDVSLNLEHLEMDGVWCQSVSLSGDVSVVPHRNPCSANSSKRVTVSQCHMLSLMAAFFTMTPDHW
jgi:hypothetical protein